MNDRFDESQSLDLGLTNLDDIVDDRFAEQPFEESPLNADTIRLKREERRRKRQKHKINDMKAEGMSERDIAQNTMGALQSNRDAGIHASLQKTGIYSQLKDMYQAEAQALPPGIKLVNLAGRLIGYQTPAARNLNDLISLCSDAVKTEFRDDYKPLVHKGLELFIDRADQSVGVARNQLKHVGTQKEKYIVMYEDLQAQANDAADEIVNLKNELEGYEQKIPGLRKELSSLKRSAGREMSAEDNVKYANLSETLNLLIKEKGEIKHAITEYESDLKRYDVKLQACDNIVRQHEAVEAKFQDHYDGFYANLEQAKMYVANGDPGQGFMHVFDTMQALTEINNDLVPILNPIQNHFVQALSATNDMPLSKPDSVMDATMVGVADTVRQKTADLVEKYRTKDLV